MLDVTAVDYTYERRMILNYNEGREDEHKAMLLEKISKKRHIVALFLCFIS